MEDEVTSTWNESLNQSQFTIIILWSGGGIYLNSISQYSVPLPLTNTHQSTATTQAQQDFDSVNPITRSISNSAHRKSDAMMRSTNFGNTGDLLIDLHIRRREKKSHSFIHSYTMIFISSKQKKKHGYSHKLVKEKKEKLTKAQNC